MKSKLQWDRLPAYRNRIDRLEAYPGDDQVGWIGRRYLFQTPIEII